MTIRHLKANKTYIDIPGTNKRINRKSAAISSERFVIEIKPVVGTAIGHIAIAAECAKDTVCCIEIWQGESLSESQFAAGNLIIAVSWIGAVTLEQCSRDIAGMV